MYDVSRLKTFPSELSNGWCVTTAEVFIKYI